MSETRMTSIGTHKTTRWPVAVGLMLTVLLVPASAHAREPFAASGKAIALDRHIDWSRARLIVVQDANRYKTLESFARETMTAMTGSEHLPGLSPLASVFEWLFNRGAYLDAPVVRIKDKGLRFHFSAHLETAQRERIIATGYMTPRELVGPVVQQRMRQLEARNAMLRAMQRVRDAEAVVLLLQRMLRIVPDPDPAGTAPWYTPDALLAKLPDEFLQQAGTTRAEVLRESGGVMPDISREAALAVGYAWSSLRVSWLGGDAAGGQQALDELVELLPKLAAPGVYPEHSQRTAEARYYRMGKFTWGWFVYFLGALVSAWALVTQWRTPRFIALVLLVAGMVVHAYGLGLRWYILGRIPVANMFEAVVFSAWVGVAVALVVELAYRTQVLLLGSHATGFFALVLGGYVIPGRGTLTSVMGILDDVMLRLHTVAIIAAYALIFLAAVVAVVYLAGYYFRPLPARFNPGDKVPTGWSAWLSRCDWSHLIILNMVFVLLFVGTILGAVWADYSWGRPWGWDPKEVFALNTWLIYAILIHVRHVVQAKGVWTAWLSIAGCLMMAFNWYVVNYYIVGLHSYA